MYSHVFARLVLWINKELLPATPRAVKSSIGILE
jgi:myosin heavy subunit